MIDPYLLDLPAVISFSGGRTSGFMLRKILDAHDGQPDNLKVCFQNTGLEHAATYEFVREVGERWCDVTWLEYCVDDEGEHDYKIVDYESASRKGEPMTAIIMKRGHLPNPVSRICTVNLKMRTMDRHIRTLPEFAESYTNAVGLRADEPRRVAKLQADNSREITECPVAKAGHAIQDVLRFWEEQPFDLGLPINKAGASMAGNCVGCMLKAKPKIEILMHEMPEYFEYWIETEKLGAKIAKTKAGAFFRSDRPSYASLLETVQRQGILPFGGVVPEGEDDTVPCMCHD